LIAVIGIASSAVGIILMFRYGIPAKLPRLGEVAKALSDKDAAEDERRRALGFVGLGTFTQIISVARGVY
jgi:hypothetical protein